MKARILLFTFIFCMFFLGGYPQDIPVRPTTVTTGTYHGLSKPLRDCPVMTKAEFQRLVIKGKKRELNEGLKKRVYPYAATALPKGPDPAWQDFMGTTGNKSPIVNFAGQGSPYFPPDCNGTAGPNHFMQTINMVYAIYDKSGTIVAGPSNLNQLFSGLPGANDDLGDPIILYDDQADRWVVTEIAGPYSGPNYFLMAVSTTNDPTGTWHKYSFSVANFPDYPKLSVWRDGYYLGLNNDPGNDIYVFEREQVLIGGTARLVGFNNAWRPTSVDGFLCVPPIDNDGQFAPEGTPGLFIAFNDDALGGGSDQLWLYELAVNWTLPSASTFIRTQQLDVLPFNSSFGNNWDNIEQKGTSQRLDGIPQVIMNVPQYRNFGSYQTIVCCQTVNVNGIRHAGIRWYELRKTNTTWSVRQQGTYAPDFYSRWMGSIMLNGHNEIALGYSISGTTMYPSILYCGQSAAAYAEGAGILDIAEDTIQKSTNSQTAANRWGDYSQMSVDPTDDKTFWFTNEYGGSRKTKIASFKFIEPPVAVTLPADSINVYTANLNGSVNPNGFPTNYIFRYGTSPLSLSDSTPVSSAGSGFATLDVFAPITGLLEGTTYYFAIFSSSEGGPANGDTLSFTTGIAPYLTVTPTIQNVPTVAGNVDFYVNSNTTWSVVSDAAWCTTTPSGTGSDTIHTSFSENTSVMPRVANITVSGAGVPVQTVVVAQEGVAPMLSVTPPNQNTGTPAGNTQFDVASNTTWTVLCDVSWCTVTPSGSYDGTIIATYSENTSLTQRLCTITVTAPGLAPVTVTVTQDGFVPLLSVSPQNQNVAAISGSTAFEVASNTAWTVVSDATWCTITPSGSGNGTIVADYTQNPANQPRIANIEVTVASLPVKKVTVTQAKSSIGVNELPENSIQIFPNPTRGIFKIVPAQSNYGILDICVQDLTGKVVFKKQCKGENDYQIDLSSAPQGAYHIIIKTETSLLVRKLVVIK